VIATRNELRSRIDSLNNRVDSTNQRIDSLREEMKNEIFL